MVAAASLCGDGSVQQVQAVDKNVAVAKHKKLDTSCKILELGVVVLLVAGQRPQVYSEIYKEKLQIKADS